MINTKTCQIVHLSGLTPQPIMQLFSPHNYTNGSSAKISWLPAHSKQLINYPNHLEPNRLILHQIKSCALGFTNLGSYFHRQVEKKIFSVTQFFNFGDSVLLTLGGPKVERSLKYLYFRHRCEAEDFNLKKPCLGVKTALNSIGRPH